MEIENDINLIRNKSLHFPENGAKWYTQPFSYKLFKLKPQFYFIFMLINFNCWAIGSLDCH
jgi:hypothetical protein